MKKVLFICMGNICRSSMAEGILRDKVRMQGLSIDVDSAGTHHYHVGEQYDQRARQELAKHQIDVDDLRSRRVCDADFDEFDVIFVADENNKADLLREFGDKANKVEMMTSYSAKYYGQPVPDPYYGGDSGFAAVYAMLDESLEKWLQKIL